MKRYKIISCSIFIREIYGLDKTYDELVQLYGQENADYLADEMSGQDKNDTLFYIDLKETSIKENINKFIIAAKKRNQKYKMLNGNISLLNKLIDGDWDDDFLIIPPDSYIEPSYNDDVLKTSN